MTLDIAIETAKIFGVPIVMSAIAVWAFATGRVYSKSAVEKMLELQGKDLQGSEDRNKEYWGIIKPLIHVTSAALEAEETKVRSRR